MTESINSRKDHKTIKENLKGLRELMASMPDDFEFRMLLDQHNLLSLITSIEKIVESDENDIANAYIALEIFDRLNDLALDIESLAKRKGILYHISNPKEMDDFLKKIIDNKEIISLDEKVYNTIGYTILSIHLDLIFKAFDIAIGLKGL